MNDFYHVGGSVPINSRSYIKREADDILYNALRNGEFCYVLNSRQMGKSSLWVQAQNRLKNDGIQCATIDLSGFGNNLSEDSWYTIIFRELVKAFDLSSEAKTEAQNLWDGRSDTSPVYTLTQFVENVLLKEIEESIIICFDEIDSVLSFNFSSDPFFSFIRSCHEKRYSKPIYQRLTFCILGVASTADFIQNKLQSPFNIGKDIALEGFSKGEALKLADGLTGKVENPERVLELILGLTGGQPFLTQKICQLIYDSRTKFQNQWFRNSIDIDDFIVSQIINNWESNDSPQHLRTIRDRLLKNSSQTTKKLLELYREILAQGDIKYDGSPEQIKLRLTGLVVQSQGKLRVYNKIYRNIFDERWTENELNKIPPYIELYKTWLQSQKDSNNLLWGEQLQKALEWREGKNLNQQERDFIELSRLEQEQKQQNIEQQQQTSRKSQRILSSVFEDTERELLITEIFKWTGNQPLLTEIITSLVVNHKDNLEKGKEQEFIEQIIQKHIIENWQSNQASGHLTEIEEQILGTDGNIEERLEIYQDTLQFRVLADNNPEKIALVQSQLVIKKEDYLEVANRIYKKVFNLQWVNQQLEGLINYESNPQPVTVQISMIIFLCFMIAAIVSIWSTIKISDSSSSQQETLNEELYIKALEEGANNRIKEGIIYLCQIKEIPKDIKDARDKLKDWYNRSNGYWRDDVIESLGQIDNCSATEGTEFEQYLKK